MASPTDLTSRLAHLRDRNTAPVAPDPSGKPKQVRSSGGKTSQERKLADDYFMIFVYALLGVAVSCQLVLIVLLDVL